MYRVKTIHAFWEQFLLAAKLAIPGPVPTALGVDQSAITLSVVSASYLSALTHALVL